MHRAQLVDLDVEVLGDDPEFEAEGRRRKALPVGHGEPRLIGRAGAQGGRRLEHELAAIRPDGAAFDRGIEDEALGAGVAPDLIVADLLQGVSLMHGHDTARSRHDGAALIHGALKAYGQYFDDPAWKPDAPMQVK